MNNDDVRDWVAYHSAAFPMFKRVMSGLDEQAKRYAWQMLINDLRQVDLADAKEATNRMRTWDTVPKVEQHVAQVRRIARDLEHERQSKRSGSVSHRYDGDPSYRCLVCRDSGLAYFYAGSVPGMRRKFVNLYGETDAAYFNTITTNCFCDAASQPQERLHEDHVHYVSAWKRRKQLTEDELAKVIEGVVVPVKWHSKPSMAEL